METHKDVFSIEVSSTVPNSLTLIAPEEGNRIAYDKTVPSYVDMAALREALEV